MLAAADYSSAFFISLGLIYEGKGVFGLFWLLGYRFSPRIADMGNSALRRSRLSWVNQNYIRNETLTAGNARLVSAQNRIALVHHWGDGEVVSADGLRSTWKRKSRFNYSH